MLRLAKMSILPHRFLKLRNGLPPYIYFIFRKAHRRTWLHKSSFESSSAVLCLLDIEKPVQQVCTDQNFYAQPVIFTKKKA